jgi:hypothetical protein
MAVPSGTAITSLRATLGLARRPVESKVKPEPELDPTRDALLRSSHDMAPPQPKF